MIKGHFKLSHSELKTLMLNVNNNDLLRSKYICVRTGVTQKSVRTELMIGTVLLPRLPS